MPCQIQDVTGLGVIVGHVKDLILLFFEYWFQRRERQLKYDSLRLQYTREFLQLASDFHMTPEELKSYMTLASDVAYLSGQNIVLGVEAGAVQPGKAHSLPAREKSVLRVRSE